MPKLLIHGAKGRMGQAVRACALESGDWEIVGEIDLGDSLEEALPKAEVVVDFSAHDAVGPLCRACLQAKKPLVSGTTGLDTETRQLLQQAAQSIPIVWASNFSVGVNTLFWLVEHATRILGEGFDVEIMPCGEVTSSENTGSSLPEAARNSSWFIGRLAGRPLPPGRYGLRPGFSGNRPVCMTCRTSLVFALNRRRSKKTQARWEITLRRHSLWILRRRNDAPSWH